VVVQPWPWNMLPAEISEPESDVRGGVMGDAGTTGARGEGVLPVASITAWEAGTGAGVPKPYVG
jgi:hypothetical protein